MTDDLIHSALAARADEHERALAGARTDQRADAAPLTLHHREAPSGSKHVRVLAGAAAAVVVTLAIAGGLLLGGGADDALVGSAGDGVDDRSEPPATPSDSDIGAFTEAAARAHLENFATALDRRDFSTAAEMLGGEHLAASVADALRLGPGDRTSDALERYCDQDRTFCAGLSVGELAAEEPTLRAFLVTTPIPPGSLGDGEPTHSGLEHSGPFRVEWASGSMRVLDLPLRVLPDEVAVALDVVVLNGSGRCGIADNVADAIRAQPFAEGLRVLPPANASQQVDHSTVYAAADTGTPAELIADLLEPRAEVAELTSEVMASLDPSWQGAPPTLVLVLGSDQASAWPGC